MGAFGCPLGSRNERWVPESDGTLLLPGAWDVPVRRAGGVPLRVPVHEPGDRNGRNGGEDPADPRAEDQSDAARVLTLAFGEPRDEGLRNQGAHALAGEVAVCDRADDAQEHVPVQGPGARWTCTRTSVTTSSSAAPKQSTKKAGGLKLLECIMAGGVPVDRWKARASCARSSSTTPRASAPA